MIDLCKGIWATLGFIADGADADAASKRSRRVLWLQGAFVRACFGAGMERHPLLRPGHEPAFHVARHGRRLANLLSAKHQCLATGL